MPPRRQNKAAIHLDQHDFSDVAFTLQASALRSPSESSAVLSQHAPQNIANTTSDAEGAPTESSAMVRAEADAQRLAQELVARQWTSSDLVSHAFGDLVLLPLAARILYLFLDHGVLAVANQQSPDQDLPVGEWADVCARAVFLTALQQGSTEGSPGGQLPTDSYVWRWHSCFDTSTEKHTVDFLNIVGVLAYVCAMSVDGTFATRHTPAVRFSTMPNPMAAFPLPHDKQDSRPDLFALPYKAFRKTQPSDSATSDLMDNTRILPYILNNFPKVFSYEPEVDDTSKARGSIPPLQFMSHSSPCTTSESDLGPFERLRQELSLLSQPAAHPTPMDLPSNLQTMFDADKLDVSHACWPAILLSGENKQNDIHEGIMQELVYMQQQRCTQPHLRFVLGLACTEDETVLLRADAIGTERHHIRNTTSTGVVELIQLVLGLTLANDELLGVHPSFVFQEVTKSFSSDKKTEPKSYRHRQAVYMDISSDSASGEATRFYLDQLMDTSGSLIGRHTVVWSAFKEVDACDSSICKEHLGGRGRVFVGPYALKMHYADVAAHARMTDIEHLVKQHADQDGAKYVLLPERTWRGEVVHQSVRGFAREGDIPEAVRTATTIRQEVVSMSPLKRTLAQYKNFGEMARAMADVYRAVQWLHSIGILHQDISNGNILLALEEPSTFTDPQQRTVELLTGEQITLRLVRRLKHEPPGVVGLLHDLDMAGKVDIPEEEHRPTQVTNVRTGTPPYMSIEVLQDLRTYHTAQDDMQSVFYVAYLFAFTYGAPATSTYPFKEPSHGHRWPPEINKWAFGPSLSSLGNGKWAFFSFAHHWLAIFEQRALAYWKERPQHKEALKELLVALHDNCLWTGMKKSSARRSQMFVTNDFASPSLAIERLDQLFEQNSELYRLP